MKYGNKSFRTWLDKVRETLHDDLSDCLPECEDFHLCFPEILPYFSESFGNYDRMDYNINHENNFLLFLMCLYKTGLLIE